MTVMFNIGYLTALHPKKPAFTDFNLALFSNSCKYSGINTCVHTDPDLYFLGDSGTCRGALIIVNSRNMHNHKL